MKAGMWISGVAGALAVLMSGAAWAQQPKAPAATPPGGQPPAAAAQANPALDRLKQVIDSYYDVPLLYPENYVCEMRSPELLNAVDPKLRQAWGQAYLILTSGAQGMKISIENAGSTTLDLSPVANQWQQLLGGAMRQFEARMPGFVAACAMSALADYQSAMVRDGAATRIDLKAKSTADMIQGVSLWIDAGNALLRYVVVDKQGGRLEVALKNTRLRSPQPKLLPASVEIYVKRAGVEEKYWVDVDYQNVFGEKGKEHVLYRNVKLKRTDVKGFLPNQLKAGEVNPVSFQFSNYRVGQPSAPRTASAPRLEELYMTNR